MNLYTRVMCTNAYGTDLKNNRVELHLDIDGDVFAYVHVSEAALDNHAGSVRSNTKLQKDKVTTAVCITDTFLFETSVLVCIAKGRALPLYAWWFLTCRTPRLYKTELFVHHSLPSGASCCSSHGTGLELSARSNKMSINCLWFVKNAFSCLFLVHCFTM